MNKIVLWPDIRLKVKAEPVAVVTSEIQEILNNILTVIRKHNAIGLSASHIGIPLQLVVVLINEPIFMVNPVIVDFSDEKHTSEEGSISFPRIVVPIERHYSIKVEYLDYFGVTQLVEYSGLTATCIQHEIDQMNGVTLLDRLSPLKRDFYTKKLMKK
jgi:peptide deformylase